MSFSALEKSLKILFLVWDFPGFNMINFCKLASDVNAFGK